MSGKTIRTFFSAFPRTMSEVIGDDDMRRLEAVSEVVWAKDGAPPSDMIDAEIPRVDFFVGFDPEISSERIAAARNLKAIFDVSGVMPSNLDYGACFSRGIRVMGSAPAFGRQVAEMGLSLALASARGVVRNHERTRIAQEVWKNDEQPLDRSLFGANVGFVGFGGLARNLVELLRPFGCKMQAYDPWLPAAMVSRFGVVPTGLHSVMRDSEFLFLLASPTEENAGMISRELLSTLPDGATVVLLSRAHLVDFSALCDFADQGRISAAVDVFPEEPMPDDAVVRGVNNMILSPHRGASIRRLRRSIGEAIVDDIELMAKGLPPVSTQRIEPESAARLTKRTEPHL